MSNAFLTPALTALLLSLGIGAASAQQNGVTVEAPSVPKPAVPAPAPAQPGLSISAADRKAEQEAARLCATIKERPAEIACLQAHAANRAAEKDAAEKRAKTVPAPDTNQRAMTPAQPQSPARPGG